MITLPHYLVLAGILFSIAVAGIFLNRKNVIVLLMCIELMLNAVNLTFVSFARYQATTMPTVGDQQASMMTGQMMVIFVMAVAAAEVAVGLGIIMAIFRLRDDIDIDELHLLRG